MGNPIASGLMCLGPSFFCSAAFILSVFADLRCHFYRLDDGNPWRGRDFGYGSPDRFGLWCYQDRSGINWGINNITFDDKFETARGLGTATICIGGILWFFYLFAGCKPFPPVAFKFIGLLGVINCILQSLVFLLNKSAVCAEGCTISTGGNCAIAAAVFYFVGGILSCAAGEDVDAAGEGEGGGGGDGA